MAPEDFVLEDLDAPTVAAFLRGLEELTPDLLEMATLCRKDPEFLSFRDSLQIEITTLLGYELDEVAGRRGVFLVPEAGPRGFMEVRPLLEGSAEVHGLWRALRDELLGSTVRALVLDALFSSRVDADQAHATAVIEAYLSSVGEAKSDLIQDVMSLERADTIARMRGLPDLETRVRSSAIEFARLHVEKRSPSGVPGRACEIASRAPSSRRMLEEERIHVADLLNAASQAYEDAVAADWIADCRRSIARTEEERLLATREQVDRYLLTAANERTGFAAMHWAESAAKVASQHHDRQSHEAAVRAMQEYASGDMGWQTIETKAAVPMSMLRKVVKKFRAARDWRHGLQFFLTSPSPGGSYVQNLREADTASKGSIRALVSRVTFGPHNLPERTNGDFLAEELSRNEQISVRTNGTLLGLELDEIRDRFEVPTEDEIAHWLVAQFDCRPEHAKQFGRALALYWQGSFSDSARISIPLIEAAARELLLLLNAAIYRTQQGESPGRFPALDFYISALEDLDLDIDWVRALRAGLLSPGLNLRNLAAHGFHFEFTQADAALLLRFAGLFCTLPSSPNDLDLRQPLQNARRKMRRRLRLRWEWR